MIDGGSDDGSLGIIDRYQGFIATIVCEPDRGISDALNKGVSLATGELVLCINADDQLENGALHRVVEDWERAERPDILCGAIRYLDPDTGATFLESPRPDRLHRYMSVFHPAMVITRGAYQRVGPYREDYKLAMDCEWIHRAIRLGLNVKTSDNIYAIMSLNGASDLRFREALREFRRSARENRIYRFSTDIYYCQQFIFKSLMKMRWFKALKYRIDASRKHKELEFFKGSRRQ